VEAQFARPFLVATALVHGKVGIAEVDSLGTPDVLSLADRIAGVANPAHARDSAKITVRRTDGRSVTIETTVPFGAPSNPLSAAQFAAKFRDCAGNAIRSLAAADVDATLAAIGKLETLPDARVLLAPFAA
jgi:2-methylcitrate dehydratase PrpD